MRHPLLPACLVLAAIAAAQTPQPSQQPTERAVPAAAPAIPLPSEDQSRGVTKFSFIVYGDTRGRRDGTDVQYEHSLIVDAMLRSIAGLKNSAYPVRFILESGDAVADGRQAKQWNISWTPLVNRLTREVPFFLTPGNHESVTTEDGHRNYLDAVRNLIPAAGVARRMPGDSTAYSFGYGNTFVIALDANIAADEKQYDWVKGQLEGLDRARWKNIIVFCHQAPFSSGPHGGANVEAATTELRKRYMPLFNANHVRVLFSGHEHLFEHWVEHYEDASGPHRMDLIVSGGGGAPIYNYTGEPDLREFLKANESNKVALQHLVRPSTDRGQNPYHYLIVRVDGEKLDVEINSIDWGSGYAPYRSNRADLVDQP